MVDDLVRRTLPRCATGPTRSHDALVAEGIEVSSIGLGEDVLTVSGPVLSVDPLVQERARAVAADTVGDLTVTFGTHQHVVPAIALSRRSGSGPGSE